MKKLLLSLVMVCLFFSCYNPDMEDENHSSSNHTPSPLIGTWKADDEMVCSIFTFGEDKDFVLDCTSKRPPEFGGGHYYAYIYTGKYTDKNTYFLLHNITVTNKDTSLFVEEIESHEWPYRIEDDILFLHLPTYLFDIPHYKVIQ